MSQQCSDCSGYLMKGELGPACSICNREHRERVNRINSKLLDMFPDIKVNYVGLCIEFGAEYIDEVLLPALSKQYNVVL